ncbi:MAG TPA: sensor histidine kinase [Vicinamibacterales bacterium]|nr:sensor histidine kinase [Vicinamibacterales bacterium]
MIPPGGSAARKINFLRQHPAQGHAAARLERVLAIGRAFLTVWGLVAVYVDPTEPSGLAELSYALLVGYALYSVIVLVFVERATRLAPRDGEFLHGIDILWTAVLTFVSNGVGSPFFLFFIFVVLAAAFRWGFRATMITAAVVFGLVAVQTLILAAGPWGTLFSLSGDEINRTIMRVAYLLLSAFMVGYLGEQEKLLRAETTTMAAAGRQPRVDLGLGGSVTAVARELLQTFDASAVDFVIQDFETRRTMLWRVDRSDAGASRRALHLKLDPSQQDAWLFDDPGSTWSAKRLPDGKTFSVRISQQGIWPLAHATIALPTELVEARPFTTVAASNLGLAEEWRGRVYLFDAAGGDNLERSLHFLEQLTEHIAPALTNVFLLRRLRSRAGAVERARVSRELHDGAIQSLFGIQMKIEALRRGTTLSAEEADKELGEVHDLLQREVLALRELMQALRPLELETSDQLPDVLASLVERFRRDTSVSARFIWTGGPISLPSSTALELARIVQEALVNVRKHSRARNVLVRLTNSDDTCTLIIEDDGQGFEFEGRLSARELEKRRIGPAIIKERARIAGAQLSVDSTPGVGARLELTFNNGVHA